MKFIFAFFIAGASLAHAAVLSQNDVSILMPFPESADEGLRASTVGGYGELLPRTVYKNIPVLMFGEAEKIYQNLRVVGIRLDPCFLKTTSPDSCQTQVRMTWQPLGKDFDGHLTFSDAAIHTLYDLPAADFQTLIAQLENLKSKSGGKKTNETLDVHPLLKSGGMESAYARELLSLILAQVGGQRLLQTTFMTVTGGETMWTFGGLVPKGDRFESLTIPRIPRKIQAFANSSADATDFAGGIAPAPQGKDTFNLIITRSDEIRDADEPQVLEGALSAFRVENPRLHSAQTMDCVSCHAAQNARVWSAKQYPALKIEERGDAIKFKSRFDTTNSSAVGDTKLLRAFGYSGNIPAISQRTVNETAEVLERLYGAHSPK